MLARNIRKTLTLGTALTLGLAASPAFAQLVGAGDLNDARDSAGNTGGAVISVNQANATTANISVLKPVVVAQWNSFNVPQNTTLNITNGSSASTASLLNRVIGGGPSFMEGTVNASDVNFWLINQNGMIFGANASINANSFYASTLDLSDSDYFNFYESTNPNRTLSFSGFGTVSLISLPGSSIQTSGDLMLFSPALNLNGTLNSTNGVVAAIAATGATVQYSAGSPVNFALTNSSVANQTIAGSITGREVVLGFAADQSLTNALLQVDANVTATTAVQTGYGIRIFVTNGSPAVTRPDVIVNGTLNSGGSLAILGSNNTTLNANVTGGTVGINAGAALSAKDVTSTVGSNNLNAYGGNLTAGAVSAATYAPLFATGSITTTSIDAGTYITAQSTGGGALSVGGLNAGTNIILDTPGATISSTGATAGGSLRVGPSTIPTTVTFTGDITAGFVDVRASGAFTAEDVTSTAGPVAINAGSVDTKAVSATGADVYITSSGAITTTTIGSTNSEVTVISTGNGAIRTGDISAATNATFNTAGLTAIGGVTAGGALTTNAGGSTTFGGDVTTGTLSINDNLTSAKNITVTNGDITLSNALTAGTLTASGAINIQTSGAVSLTGAIADSDGIGGDALTIGTTTAPSSLAISGAVSGSTVNLVSAGDISLGNVSAAAAKIDIVSNAGAVSVGAVTNSGTDSDAHVSISAQGNIEYGSASAEDGRISFFTAGGAISGGNLTFTGGPTYNDSISLFGASGIAVGDVVAGGSASFNSGGDLTVGSISSIEEYGYGNVNLFASGQITTDNIGNFDTITARSNSGGAITLGDLRADTISLDTAGALSFGNIVARAGNVSCRCGLLYIGNTYAPSSITANGLIDMSGVGVKTSGAINFDGDNKIDTLFDVAAGGPVYIHSTGRVYMTGDISAPGNDISILGDYLIIENTAQITGKIVALSADRHIDNRRGSDAIVASDHWVIYLNSPDDRSNRFNGLDSGNTAIWNATYDTLNPADITGNRYVFAYQPTITVVSTDANKVYGTDLGGMLGSNWSASGFQPGIAGAFLADTQANVLNGAPIITSSGTAANADVAGGPYVIDIAQGTLGTNRGYALSFSSAGRLTVTPKPISGTVSADDKTYDGTTGATGSIVLSGVLAGDEVSTASSTFVFDTKNAGTDKTVTVTANLTGADATNYTLTVPASTLADIIAKAITGTVTANDKTYDGTTAGTGTITLNGVVAGDTVGTSGTAFTFSDKNAGTDKVVSIGGTTLTGADAGNYTLTIPASTLADIFAKAITATVNADDKTYDGTTAGTGSITLNGVVAGDAVDTSGTAFTFADKNAGTDKVVSVSGTTLTGADAGNYTLTVPASTLADILAKAITGTVTANDKTYDGSTAGTGSITLSGVVSGDSVDTSGTTFTFADKNAGSDKVVSIGGTVLTGADAGNYTLTIPASALADILAKAITATVGANDKTYDGTTAGTGSITLNGVVAGDSVGTSGTTFTFSDENAGADKVVSVGGTTLTGADAGNYTLTVPATTVADILKRLIAISADNQSKVEGENDPTLTYSVTGDGLVAGDALTGSLTRDSGEAAGDYAILLGSLTAGQNYTIQFTPGTLTIAVAPVTTPQGDIVPATLRTLPLPGDFATSGDPAGSGEVIVEEEALCGPETEDCVAG